MKVLSQNTEEICFFTVTEERFGIRKCCSSRRVIMRTVKLENLRFLAEIMSDPRIFIKAQECVVTHTNIEVCRIGFYSLDTYGILDS